VVLDVNYFTGRRQLLLPVVARSFIAFLPADRAERGGVTAGFACRVARLLGTSAEALLSTPSAELAQALTRTA
jgi:hypothetical protein